MLFDNHNRPINYLRLAVTDRCNLRCTYCMPEDGLEWLHRKEIMSYEEMLRVCGVMVKMGIDKIRITGGEPFAKKDIMLFISELAKLEGLKKINLTTNGVLTEPYISEFKKLKITSCNLSLDTLDRERFFEITRRDELPAVLKTMDALLAHDIEVKVNAVVMNGVNSDEIAAMVALTKDLPIAMRFIEEMPFNGEGNDYSGILWNHKKILNEIKHSFPNIYKIKDPENSTAFNYQIPNHKGTVGIIAAYTRSFCGTCNRIRLTPEGSLKTCLYGDSVLNVKDMMRNGFSDDEMAVLLKQTFQNRAKDGWEAEKNRKAKGIFESMAMIGG
jgi:molybdenum cofactor biosynthesis protein A